MIYMLAMGIVVSSGSEAYSMDSTLMSNSENRI